MEINLNFWITETPVYSGHDLHWYGQNLVKIVNRLNTPVHVASAHAAKDSYRFFRKPFLDEGLPIQIYYSVKTNPLPIYLQLLYELGSGFETVTESDLFLLQNLGIPPHRIIHTGDPQLLVRRNIDPSKLKMITVSTPGQTKKLVQIQRDLNKKLSVGLTINPQLLSGYWNITLNTSRKSSPLGFHPNSESFFEIVQMITDNPGLNLSGLQMHLGSGIQSVKPYMKAIRTLEEAAFKLKDLGHSISILDIGGGFGLPTAPSLKPQNMFMSLMGLNKHKNRTVDPSSGFYLDKIARELVFVRRNLEKNRIKIETIAAEPGRLLSGGCQLIILEITEVLHDKNGKNYLFCDAGAMSLSPMLLTEWHRVLPLKKKRGIDRHYTVLGTLPSALDQVAYSVELPEMELGDRIAVLDTGAYFLPMSTRFSGPLPPIVWIEDNKMALTREGESFEDLYSVYQVP